MKVKDAMSKVPVFCNPETNLGAAVEILVQRNCGFLPIVDAKQKVVGVITDRDVAIALGTRNRLAGEIAAAEVTTPKVESCKPTDDVDDVVPYAETQTTGKADISADDVLRTLKGLYSSQLSARTAGA